MISQRRLVHLFAGVGLALIAAGLLPLGVAAQDTATEPAAPEATPEATADATLELPTIYDLGAPPVVPTGDNSYCSVCHSLPWRVATLGDGTQLNMYINPRTVENSVHGTDNPSGSLGCVDCHGNNFPHGPTPDNSREYTLEAINACVGCHASEARDLQVGLHEKAILAGNLEAAVCTDCHGAHDVQRVVEQADLIAGVCGDCHESSYAEWRVSPHVDLGPLGCATCHSQHTQMIRGGQTSNQLCINCHEENENMPEIWVHINHLAEDTGVGCVDCHLSPLYPAGERVNTNVSIEDRQTGHTMEVTTVPCTTCHEAQQVSAEQTVTIVEPSADLVEPEAHGASPETTNAVSLVQGLLLGLGLGATGAAIVIARGKKYE